MRQGGYRTGSGMKGGQRCPNAKARGGPWRRWLTPGPKPVTEALWLSIRTQASPNSAIVSGADQNIQGLGSQVRPTDVCRLTPRQRAGRTSETEKQTGVGHARNEEHLFRNEAVEKSGEKKIMTKEKGRGRAPRCRISHAGILTRRRDSWGASQCGGSIWGCHQPPHRCGLTQPRGFRPPSSFAHPLLPVLAPSRP